MTFTLMEDEYQKTVDLAVAMTIVTTRENIIAGASWLPFTILYEQMLKRKEITPLRDLSQDLKVKYWADATGDRFRRKCVAQALYVFDLITS